MYEPPSSVTGDGRGSQLMLDAHGLQQALVATRAIRMPTGQRSKDRGATMRTDQILVTGEVPRLTLALIKRGHEILRRYPRKPGVGQHQRSGISARDTTSVTRDHVRNALHDRSEQFGVADLGNRQPLELTLKPYRRRTDPDHNTRHPAPGLSRTCFARYLVKQAGRSRKLHSRAQTVVSRIATATLVAAAVTACGSSPNSPAATCAAAKTVNQRFWTDLGSATQPRTRITAPDLLRDVRQLEQALAKLKRVVPTAKRTELRQSIASLRSNASQIDPAAPVTQAIPIAVAWLGQPLHGLDSAITADCRQAA
jgi:hypothetical protein